MQLYARIFTQILDSSLAENWQARHVFEDLLKLANNGIVDMTRQAIARRTNVPLEVINEAIAILEDPDPASRDPADDGRRLVRLDDHRDWGWMIVNWEKYERIKSTIAEREQTRARMRRMRERRRANLPHSPSFTESASATASASEEASQERNAPSQSVTHRNSRNGRPAGAGPTSKGRIESDWLGELKADPAFAGINIDLELAKMNRWCKEHRKESSRRRFVNWLNRADRPVTIDPQPTRRFETAEISPEDL